MLYKQKNADFSFDLFKKKINKNNKKPYLKKFALLFISCQLVSFAYHSYNIHAYKKQNSRDFFNSLELAHELHESLVKGDQEEIVTLFTKLKYMNTPSADIAINPIMLSSSNYQEKSGVKYLVNSSEDFFNYKISPETMRTIRYIYEHNYNSGVLKEKNTIEKTNCYYIDIGCYMENRFLKKDLNLRNRLVEVGHYEVNHYKEYLNWSDKLSEKIKNETATSKDYRSPGYYYAEQINISFK